MAPVAPAEPAAVVAVVVGGSLDTAAVKCLAARALPLGVLLVAVPVDLPGVIVVSATSVVSLASMSTGSTGDSEISELDAPPEVPVSMLLVPDVVELVALPVVSPAVPVAVLVEDAGDPLVAVPVLDELDGEPLVSEDAPVLLADDPEPSLSVGVA